MVKQKNIGAKIGIWGGGRGEIKFESAKGPHRNNFAFKMVVRMQKE